MFAHLAILYNTHVIYGWAWFVVLIVCVCGEWHQKDRDVEFWGSCSTSWPRLRLTTPAVPCACYLGGSWLPMCQYCHTSVPGMYPGSRWWTTQAASKEHPNLKTPCSSHSDVHHPVLPSLEEEPPEPSWWQRAARQAVPDEPQPHKETVTINLQVTPPSCLHSPVSPSLSVGAEVYPPTRFLVLPYFSCFPFSLTCGVCSECFDGCGCETFRWLFQRIHFGESDELADSIQLPRYNIHWGICAKAINLKLFPELTVTDWTLNWALLKETFAW